MDVVAGHTYNFRRHNGTSFDAKVMGELDRDQRVPVTIYKHYDANGNPIKTPVDLQYDLITPSTYTIEEIDDAS